MLTTQTVTHGGSAGAVRQRTGLSEVQPQCANGALPQGKSRETTNVMVYWLIARDAIEEDPSSSPASSTTAHLRLRPSPPITFADYSHNQVLAIAPPVRRGQDAMEPER